MKSLTSSKKGLRDDHSWTLVVIDLAGMIIQSFIGEGTARGCLFGISIFLLCGTALIGGHLLWKGGSVIERFK